MNTFVLLMIFASCTVEYLTQAGLLPHGVKYSAEIISGLTLIMVVILGARNRFQFVRAAYWFAFAAVAATITCGIVANAMVSGPVFAGMRNYLRAVPLFFLPAVYAFSERQIRTQLWVLLLLSLGQLPIAIHQRLTRVSTGGASGDTTAGTLMGSGLLSIFLICVICVLTGAFLKKRIRMTPFLVLFVLLLIPTTINETKATVLLLPVGLLVTFVAGSERGTRLKNAAIATALIMIAGSIFVPIYDYYASLKGNGTSITDFFADKEKLETYVDKDAALGTRLRQVGRGDALMVPLREMARDPTHLAFGLGIGNASQSSLGDNFTGKYFLKFQPFLKSSGTVFILEIGLLGIALALLIDYLIYRDSRVVAEVDQGIIGTLAVGWAGVTVIILMTTFYANLVKSEAVSYLFWYFSGVVAAQRCRLFRQVPAVTREVVAPSWQPAAGRRGLIVQNAGHRGQLKAKY